MSSTIENAKQAREAINDMVQLSGLEQTKEWIATALNCRQVSIDVNGDVMIADPQSPHYLSGNELVSLVNRINAGV